MSRMTWEEGKVLEKQLQDLFIEGPEHRDYLKVRDQFEDNWEAHCRRVGRSPVMGDEPEDNPPPEPETLVPLRVESPPPEEVEDWGPGSLSDQLRRKRARMLEAMGGRPHVPK